MRDTNWAETAHFDVMVSFCFRKLVMMGGVEYRVDRSDSPIASSSTGEPNLSIVALQFAEAKVLVEVCEDECFSRPRKQDDFALEYDWPRTLGSWVLNTA